MLIMVVEDDKSLRSALSIILSESGYQTCEASCGLDAIALFIQARPSLIVLDIGLPDMSGFKVCGAIREHDLRVPVLYLSARGAIADKTTAFRSGGDDYLTKPFSRVELLLRIEALLRRSNLMGVKDLPAIVEIEGLAVYLEKREVIVDGRKASLTPTEYRIISLLAENKGKSFSRQEIVERVWGGEYHDQDVGLPTHIRHLREKVERDPAHPRYIQTVGRLGYRLGD